MAKAATKLNWKHLLQPVTYDWTFVQSPAHKDLLMLGEGNESHDYQELEDIFNFSPPPDNQLFSTISTIVYSSLAIIGFLANLFFCIVIWRTEKLHTVTHMLMTNLALSNLLFLLFHPPYFLTTYILESNWVYGIYVCKASFSIGYVTVTASFYFMSLVAVDRWFAIFRRHNRLNRRKCVQLTLAAWAISVVVAAPYVYIAQDTNIYEFGVELTTNLKPFTRCGGRMISWYDELLIFTFVVQYCIPLMVMIPCYGHLAIYLWRRPTIGVQSKEKTKKAHARRKRLIFTLIGIVVILILCWTPLFSIGVIHRIKPLYSPITPYIITSMIALVGVLFTPVCYLTNDGFSNQVINIMRAITCSEKRNTRTENGTTRKLLNESENNLYHSTNAISLSSPNIRAPRGSDTQAIVLYENPQASMH